jgi:hypothetical protein
MFTEDDSSEIQIWGKMSAIEAQHYIKKLKVCSLLDFIDKDLGGLSMKKISSYFAQTQSRCHTKNVRAEPCLQRTTL